jgi:DNA polymerase I-like protein with 3'-5' exonuclease and polymerase domains
MQTILTDFAKLGDYLSGVYEVVEDELAGQERYRALDREQTVEWAQELQGQIDLHKARGEDFTVSADTEWTPDNKIWCATFCYEPGDAVLIWPENLPLLAGVLSQVRITLHSSQADIGPLQSGGIPVDANNLGDTMVAAYLLGKPQGLKAICRTECGMEMMDYSEVVNPEQRRLEYEYCQKALMVPIPEKAKGDRRATIHGLIKRCLLDMDKEEAGGKPIKPADRWKTWDDERKQPIVDALGEFPRASLADVELERAVWYACRDADGTERSRRKLEGQLRAWHSWK